MRRLGPTSDEDALTALAVHGVARYTVDVDLLTTPPHDLLVGRGHAAQLAVDTAEPSLPSGAWSRRRSLWCCSSWKPGARRTAGT